MVSRKSYKHINNKLIEGGFSLSVGNPHVIFFVENLNEFKNHIKKYHSVDGVGDNSLHIEGGRFFTISKTFYENLMNV